MSDVVRKPTEIRVGTGIRSLLQGRQTPRGTRRAGTIFRYLMAALFILSTLFPLAWMVISGFKARTEVVSSPFLFFPEVWMMENYTDILADPLFLRSLAVSFGGALLFAALSLAVNTTAAYAFARLDFAFKRTLFVIVMLTMFIPVFAIQVTSYIVVTRMGMLNTLWVLVVPGATAAVHIFFARQFFLSVPKSIEEAALVDGAGRWQVFWKVFLPMSLPVLVLIGITSFLAFWNAYIWPLLTITEPDSPLTQIQPFLATFRSERRIEYGRLLAGSAIAASPAILLFLIFQRHIISGIRISGIK